MARKQKRNASEAVIHQCSEDESVIVEATPQKKSKKKVKANIPIYSTEDIDDLIVSERSIFPTDLKQRHPLFGADYEERCSLTGLCHQLQKVQSKERRKKRIKAEPMDYDEVDEALEHKIETKADTPSKKKKRKSTAC